MKKILLSALFLATSYLYAQAPQGVSYQAVAFNTTGTPVTNANVGVKISILSGSITGTVLYAETHTKATNAQGLFNLNIGQGTAVTGTFSSINWGGGNKFIKVEIDPTGGTSYTVAGTNQLMSVPYALYAEKINTASFAGMGTSVFTQSNFSLIDGNKVHVFSNDSWYTKTCSNYPSTSEVIGSNGNFLVLDGQNVYVFSNGTWSTKTCSNYPYTSDIITSEGNFAVVDGQNVYAFSNGTWVTKTCSDYVYSSSVFGSKGNFAISDGTQAHAFSNGSWVSKTCSNYIESGSLIESNGRFLVIDGQNAHVFSNGAWISKTATNYLSTSDTVISTTE